MYRHLFFDLDHTFWDFEAASEATWRLLWDTHHLQAVGFPGFDAFFDRYNYHNNRMWKRFRDGHMKRDELRWKRIRDTCVDFRIPQNMPFILALSEDYLRILPTQTRLMPGAVEVLQYCADRYTVHLITNGFESTQKQKIEHAGIGHYFTEIITSERSSCLKPHREIFDFALRCSGSACKDSLMIGDSMEADVLGAMAAGWDAVYYNPGQTPHREKPSYEIAHLNELIDLV